MFEMEFLRYTKHCMLHDVLSFLNQTLTKASLSNVLDCKDFYVFLILFNNYMYCY